MNLGFTGFLPGSKYIISQTFGKATEMAAVNTKVEKGELKMEMLDRALNKPIAGYKGFVPKGRVVEGGRMMNSLF